MTDVQTAKKWWKRYGVKMRLFYHLTSKTKAWWYHNYPCCWTYSVRFFFTEYGEKTYQFKINNSEWRKTYVERSVHISFFLAAVGEGGGEGGRAKLDLIGKVHSPFFTDGFISILIILDWPPEIFYTGRVFVIPRRIAVAGITGLKTQLVFWLF